MNAPNFGSRRFSGLIAGLITGLAVVAGLAWVLASRGQGGQAEQRHVTAASVPGQQGLDIRNVAVARTNPSGNLVEIRYDIVWSSEQFPGTRTCTWELLGPDGSVVGSDSTEVVSLRPLVTGATREVPATDPAVSARGSCSGSRLDDDASPTYAYEISNVSVGKRIADGSGWRLEVDFTAKWAGSAAPGIVTCQAHAFDPLGKVVDTQSFNLSLSSTEPVEMTLVMTSDQSGGPTSALAPVRATIDSCAPFGRSGAPGSAP